MSLALARSVCLHLEANFHPADPRFLPYNARLNLLRILPNAYMLIAQVSKVGFFSDIANALSSVMPDLRKLKN